MGGVGRAGTQIRLRLDGDDLGDGGGVVLEVEAVAGPQLDDAALEPGQELPAVLGLSGGFGARARPLIDAREERWWTARGSPLG